MHLRTLMNYITHSENIAELDVGGEYWRGVLTVPYKGENFI